MITLLSISLRKCLKENVQKQCEHEQKPLYTEMCRQRQSFPKDMHKFQSKTFYKRRNLLQRCRIKHFFPIIFGHLKWMEKLGLFISISKTYFPVSKYLNHAKFRRDSL